jgi:hypothetical protein
MAIPIRQPLVTSILRFNFTDDIMDIITHFSKIHQYDDRHTYRENWDKWLEANNIILLQEIERLKESGYDGDVKEKMYKAGRYYFRKKNNNVQQNGVGAKELGAKELGAKELGTKVRKRNYVCMHKVIIDEMDNHIVASLTRNKDYTPANGYQDFCKLHDTLLSIEKKRITLECNMSDENILDKFKKTYKNRYFILTR